LVYDTASYSPQQVLTDVKYALQQPWQLWTAEGSWVAYAIDVPPERANPSLLEEASKLAGKVMDKMKDYGLEKYENYFSSAKEGSKEPDRKFIKGMEDGWVLVRNLDKKGELVAYWRPHTQPLNHIKFTNSGTKIITTPIGANTFHVWDLAGTSQQPICTHVLQRGYTSALVLDMSLSPDDSWLSVTTNHGTTHLFSCQEKEKCLAQLRIRRQDKESTKDVPIVSAKLLKIMGNNSFHVSAIDSQGKLLLHSVDVDQSATPTIQSLSCWDFGKAKFLESSSDYKWDGSVKSSVQKSGSVRSSNPNEWHAHLDAVSYPDTARPIWSNPNLTFEIFDPQGKCQEFKSGHPDLTDLPETNQVNLYTSVALPNGFSSTNSKFPALNSAHKQVEEALSGALQSAMDTDSKEVVAPRLDKRRGRFLVYVLGTTLTQEDDLPFDDEWTVQLQMQDVEGHEAPTTS
jgi:hypothetical protein